MGKRRYAFTENKTVKYILEGRGTGSGADYLPWLRVQDLPSRGRSHRVWGILTQRVHHLLSDGEWKCFLRFEADRCTRDIREQFPLSRRETMQIAHTLGIRHPTTLDGTPYVMTTDFMVRKEVNGARIIEPHSFKYSTEKLTKRQKDLLKIAEVYYEKRGLRLRHTDESFFCDSLIQSFDSVRSLHSLEGLDVTGAVEPATLAEELYRGLRQRLSAKLGAFSLEIDAKCSAPLGAAWAIARHLIARRLVTTDLFNPVPLQCRPLHAFTLSAEPFQLAA